MSELTPAEAPAPPLTSPPVGSPPVGSLDARLPASATSEGRKKVIFNSSVQALAIGVMAAGYWVVIGGEAFVARFGVAPERALSVSALAGVALIILGSAVGARIAHRIALLEQLVAWLVVTIPTVTLLFLAVGFGPSNLERFVPPDLLYLSMLLGNPLSGLLLGAHVAFIAQLVGATFGYLAAGGGLIDLRISFEAHVARTHLRLSRLKVIAVFALGIVSPILLIAWPLTLIGLTLTDAFASSGTRRRVLEQLMPYIAILGVSIGVCALVTVLSVMSGFEVDLKKKILGTNAHGLVLKYGNDFSEYHEVAEKVRSVRGVKGVSPFILNEVMLTTDQNMGAGVLIKGIDPTTVGQVTDLPQNISEGGSGKLEYLIHPDQIPSSISGGHADVDKLLRDLNSATGEGDFDGDAKKEPNGKGAKKAHPGKPDAAGGPKHMANTPSEGAKTNADTPPIPGHAPSAGSGQAEPAEGHPGSAHAAGFTGEAEANRPLTNDKAADKAGNVAELFPSLPGIVLGRELARTLKVFVGDRVNVVSPLGGELGPQGPMPKSRPFRVAAIFYSGMYEYDSKFAYISLTAAQKFFGMTDTVSGLELKVDDIDNTRIINHEIYTKLDGYPYRTKDWGEMNRNLFSALRLEKLAMAIMLTFIVLVACINILSTLVVFALQKAKEVAILKSMGARDTGIMKIFVLEGLIIGTIGTILGLIQGYGCCLFVEKFGIKLDPEVYYINRLPVKLDPVQFAAVALTALLLSYLATIFPALNASRLRPVEGLKTE